jgi:hypothetical protein
MSNFLPLDISGSGENEIIPAVPSHRIQVTQMILISHGDVDLSIKTGDIALWNALPFADRGDGMVLPDTGKFWFQSEVGKPITVILSDSVRVTRMVWYRHA